MFSLIRETFSFIMANLFDITLVSLAWLALQLPVVTAPAATVAVYHLPVRPCCRTKRSSRTFCRD